MTLKEKADLTIRGYRKIHELVPGMLLAILFRQLLTSFLPFINIFMSARIISALAAGRILDDILFLVLLTVLFNALTMLLSAGMERIDSYHRKKFYLVWDKPLKEKIQQMDYERVEDSQTHLQMEHIIVLRNNMGYGLQRLIYSAQNGLSGLFTLLFSLSLLSSAFSTYHLKDAGNLNFLFSPFMTVVVLLLIGVNIAVGVVASKESMKKSAEIFSGFENANRLGGYYYRNLLNYRAGKDIKLYAMKDVLCDEFDGFNRLCAKQMTRSQKVVSKYAGIIASANTILTGIVYAFVALKALFGGFGVGNIVQYVGCLSKLSDGVTSLMSELTLLELNTEALKLFFEFTDMPDRKYLGTLPVEKRDDNEFEIEFHNVSFRYPGSERFALKNLDLKLQIGQRMAVVGMNGSGKTTMIKLLCRLYDPTEGRITLNGIDIRKYDYNEYLSIFSVVFQDFKLFSFSLGQNVAARMAYDGQKATAVLKQSGFSDRLSAMPRGLDTPLYKDFDEDGVEISGGEAQKIALARALYKNAPFIVLDEPTAALDPISEFEIYSRFHEIVGGKTAIFISHRLSSCRFCDDIAVFHEGRLVQRGSHDALLADTDGKYRELWDAQAQYYTDRGGA